MRPDKPSQGLPRPLPAAGPVTCETVIPNPQLKLLDQMLEVMRLKHYSIRTERTYCDWVRRYVHFHQMHAREQMFPVEPMIEAFLSELAVEGNVPRSHFHALLRDGAEELCGKAGSAVVRVPELAGHQRIGRQRSPERKIGGTLDDEALRGAAADAKGEMSAGCPGRRIQPQLWQV